MASDFHGNVYFGIVVTGLDGLGTISHFMVYTPLKNVMNDDPIGSGTVRLFLIPKSTRTCR